MCLVISWYQVNFSCYSNRALSEGDTPPVKDRLEFPVPESASGLTPGILRVLHKQVSLIEKNHIDYFPSWILINLQLDIFKY